MSHYYDFRFTHKTLINFIKLVLSNLEIFSNWEVLGGFIYIQFIMKLEFYYFKTILEESGHVLSTGLNTCPDSSRIFFIIQFQLLRFSFYSPL